MDLAKYVSILETSCLHFARSDLLGDPFEGSYSRGNVELRPSVYSGKVDDLETALDQMARLAKWIREWTFISCWHMNENESAAMWKLYAKSNEAVAVVSRYSRLAECLPGDVFLGSVQYIDYETEWLPEGNTLYPFTHKRRSFEHEREARAVVQNLPIEGDAIAVGRSNTETGLYFTVDPAQLIEAVYVAPTAPRWFGELVERLSGRYGQSYPVHRSSLDSEPVY